MVSVIIVNYNNADDTLECLKSFENVIDAEFEVIVVDNCSTDESVDKLKNFGARYNYILIQSLENNGFSAGNNIGIRYAMNHNPDYYLLINNDTVVEPCFLKHLIDGFSNDIHCGITTAKIKLFSDKNKLWYAGGAISLRNSRTEHFDFLSDDNDVYNNNTRSVTFVSGCCMCISSKVINKVGLLNEDYFLYEEDSDYCLKVVKSGFSMFYIPEAIIYHKVSASTGAGSPISQYYASRNKYLLIKENYIGLNKLIAYLYSSVQMLFRCVKKQMNFRLFMAGFIAFLKKEKGKSKRLIQ